MRACVRACVRACAEVASPRNMHSLFRFLSSYTPGGCARARECVRVRVRLGAHTQEGTVQVTSTRARVNSTAGAMRLVDKAHRMVFSTICLSAPIEFAQRMTSILEAVEGIPPRRFTRENRPLQKNS